MEATGHNTPLSPAECRLLLRDHHLGRVAWQSPAGIQVLPVSYVFIDNRIVLRTASGSLLSGLADPQPVGFEIDDLDAETQTGWSVLVQGTSGPGEPAEGMLTEPWAPGDRPVVVAITPTEYSGRAIAAS